MMSSWNRRRVLQAAALGPLALGAEISSGAGRAAEAQESLPAPKYTLSCNVEIMFPRTMPHADRIRLIADQGLKAFSFWGIGGKDAAAMERVQKETGLKCGSITGNGKTGWNTGLTKTGYEEAFLQDFKDHIEVAKRFNVKNLICFLGETQPDIPLDVQHRQILDGLKKAGDIAAKNDVYFCLEPLNIVESPKMSVLSARHGLKIVEEVNHPHVKLDFDMYHLQLSEGNIFNNLRQGLRKGWIRFVEIGDVPGRKEPGTGEMNYPNIFKVLREEGYADFIGMEHGTSSTPQHAIQVVKKVAGVA
jgi:hydroxypyruvate isomerase